MLTLKNRTLKIAFLLDADKLRHLSTLLEQNVLDQMTDIPEAISGVDEDGNFTYEPLYEKEIIYDVDLSDGTTIVTSSIDDVLSLPNSRSRKITSVSLTTPRLHKPIHARIRFSDSRSYPVEYDLSGDDRNVLVLADKLDDHLPGLAQWYSFLTRYSILGVVSALYIAIWLAANGFVAGTYFFFPNFLPAVANNEPAPRAVTAFLFLILAVAGASVVLDWLRSKFFR